MIEEEMMMFSHVDDYGRIPDAFHRTAETDRLFLEAMRENYKFQYERQPFIRALARRTGFSLSEMEDPEDVLRVPPLFVETMKYNRFCSISEEDIAFVLTSSGTSGQKSQAIFDSAGLVRIGRIVSTIFRGSGFVSDIPANYLMFSYAREDAQNVGTSWSDEQEMQCAPVKSAHWLLRKNSSGNFSFGSGRAADLMCDLAEDGPLRLLGFPAFIYQALSELEESGRRINVHPDSFIIAGGGWKNHSGTPMTQREFASEVERMIGLSAENVRDLYGMVEHGIPYCACPEGHHHVPVFSRVVVRDPLTMERLPYGREGLLQLLSPWNTAQPNCSILSTDLVVVETGCPCGLPGEFIASIRRGGTRKHRGCAMAAQEILDRIRAEDSKA